eukprot:754789-Hanusia_phi.AAC.2
MIYMRLTFSLVPFCFVAIQQISVCLGIDVSTLNQTGSETCAPSAYLGRFGASTHLSVNNGGSTSVVDSRDGRYLYTVSYGSHYLRKVVLKDGLTVGQDVEIHRELGLVYPWGAALTFDDQSIYVTSCKDHDEFAIRQFNTSDFKLISYIGGSKGTSDGVGTSAEFLYLRSLAITPDDRYLYACDYDNFYARIRKIDLPTKTVSTLCGSTKGTSDGSASSARFYWPYGIVLSSDNRYLYVSDLASGYSSTRIRKISTTNGAVSTIATISGRSESLSIAPDGNWLLLFDRDRMLYNVSTSTYAVTSIPLPSTVEGQALYSIKISWSGNLLYLGYDLLPTMVLTSHCVQCQESIPVFAEYTDQCSWKCREGFYQVDLPDGNYSEMVNISQFGFATDGNTSSTCVPIALAPLNNQSACFLNYTWDQLVLNEFSTRKAEFRTGGLGKWMVTDRFEVWVCEKSHTCLEDKEDFFCFLFDEVNKVFIPWNALSALKL